MWFYIKRRAGHWLPKLLVKWEGRCRPATWSQALCNGQMKETVPHRWELQALASLPSVHQHSAAINHSALNTKAEGLASALVLKFTNSPWSNNPPFACRSCPACFLPYVSVLHTAPPRWQAKELTHNVPSAHTVSKICCVLSIKL